MGVVNRLLYTSQSLVSISYVNEMAALSIN